MAAAIGSVRQLLCRGRLAGMCRDGRVPQMGPGGGLTPGTQLVEADGGCGAWGRGKDEITPPPPPPPSWLCAVMGAWLIDAGGGLASWLLVGKMKLWVFAGAKLKGWSKSPPASNFQSLTGE